MKLILVCLLVGISLTASAQTDWIPQTGPLGGNVQDVEYDQAGGRVYALVGYQLYFSDNDGATWTKSATSQQFLDIEISGTTVYLLRGFDIYTSPLGQDNFQDITTDFLLNATRIKLMPNGTLVGVSLFSAYSSVNNGVTWTRYLNVASTSFSTTMLEVSSDNKMFVIDNNVLRYSTNSGSSYTTVPGVTGTVTSIATNNAKTILYVGTTNGLIALNATDLSSLGSIKGGSLNAVPLISSTANPSLIEVSSDGTQIFFADNVSHKLHTKTVADVTNTWTASAEYPDDIYEVGTFKIKGVSAKSASTVVFGGFTSLFRTTNGGAAISLANGTITKTRPFVAGALGGILYANASDAGLYVSIDDGNSWQGDPAINGPVDYMSTSTDFLTNSTKAGFALVHLSTFNTSDLYRTQIVSSTHTPWGSPSGPIATPVEFEWAAVTDNNRAFGMGFTGGNNQFYYSNNNGTNWSGAITITGLPTTYDIDPMAIFFASSTTAFIQVYDLGTSLSEYYRITFTIGAGLTISGAATKIQSTLPFTTIDRAMGRNGRLYLYDDSTNPDRMAYSADGVTWTSRSLPTNSTNNLHVTNNGYLFAVQNIAGQVYMSRDDGVTFSLLATPSTVSGFSIRDIILDDEGYGIMVVDGGLAHKTKTPIVLPAAPTGLTEVGRTAASVALRWDDNASNEEYFKVERSSNGVDFTTIALAAGTCPTPNSRGFYADSNLLAGTTYTYRVSSGNAAGFSSAVSLIVTTLATCSPVALPNGRSWNAVSSNESGLGVTNMTVGITRIGTTNRYQITNMSLNLISGGPHQDEFILDCDKTIVLGTSTVLKPNGTGTWNGTTLTLKWRQCSADETETLTLTLNSVALDPAPSMPTNVTVLSGGNTSADIRWTTGFYQNDFLVERSTASATTGFSTIGTVGAGVSEFTDNGPLTVGTTYFYRVTARNADAPPDVSTSTPAVTFVFRKPNFILAQNDVTSTTGIFRGAWWGDFNNDDLDDLLTTSISGTGFQPKIFRNMGAGVFQDANVILDMELPENGTVVDFNNDGNLDMAFVTKDDSEVSLYQGNGDFTFTKSSTAQIGTLANVTTDVRHLSWADYDRDGLLDLLVLAGTSGANPPALFRQQSDGTFAQADGGDLKNFPDISVAQRALWADFNFDARPDVIITSGNSTRLYKNTGTGNFFVEVAATGISDVGAFTLAWTDYDNDGNQDLYHGGTPNTLYHNSGSETFTSAGTAVTESASGILSPAWGDFNNDGLVDLLGASTSTLTANSTRLYMNTSSGGTTSFNKITAEKICDPFYARIGTGLCDYDKDGLLDASMGNFVFSTSVASGLANFNLYKNNNVAAGNWLEVKLVGVESNRKAIGAKVFVTAGIKTYLREVRSPSTFFGQDGSYLHFGLANASSAMVEVFWPSGIHQTFNPSSLNQAIIIHEDNDAPLAIQQVPAVNATSVAVGSAVEITFDEPTIADNSKTIYVTRVSDGAPIFSQSVGTGVKAGNKYTFTFGSNLGQSIQYEVSFDPGAFSDVYGNAFAGLPGPWRFTTAAGPQVTLLGPLSNAVNVPSNTAISITFNVPTTAVVGKNITIYRTSDLGTPVRTMAATSAVVDGNKQTLTFTPNLPTETAFTVVVDAGAFKDAGNAVSAGGQWAFTTMPPPKFTTLVPADDATGIAANTTLEITFDQPVTAEAGKKIYLFKNAESTAVFEANVTAGTIAGNKVTFVVAPKLLPLTNYTATVDGFAFKDATGNLFTGIGTGQWNFTTIQGPLVSTFAPANGASNIATTSAIALTFNRALVSGVAGKKIRVLDGGTTIADLDVSTNGTISGPTYTLTAPSTKWPTGKLLTVELDAGAFLDAGANESVALTAGTYSFTTILGPAVASFAPANGATGVSTTAPIGLTFNRAIVSAVAGKKITVLDGGTIVANLDVATNGTISGSTYTLNAPSSRWPSDRVLTVSLDAGAFLDAAGNNSEPLIAGAYSFTTVPGPRLTALAPTNGATAVAANTTLAITFDQTVTAEAGKKVRVYKNADPTPVFEGDVTNGAIVGNKVTFVITPKLLRETDYTVVVDAFAFKDAGGNPFAGIGSTEWNFRTDVGPAVVGYAPASGASDVPTNTSIEIIFSRALTAPVAGKKIQVFDGATAVVDGTVAASGSIAGTKYILAAPSGGWSAGKLFVLALDAGAFVDAGGNESDGLASGLYSFNTAAAPTIAVVSLSPVAGATAIALNASLEITFDKNVTAVAGKTIRVMNGTDIVGGSPSNVSTTGTVAGAKYTYPAPTGGWPLDKLLTVLLDAGAFVDAASTLSPAISGSQWTFRTLNAADTQAPVLQFDPILLAKLNKNFSNTPISVNVTDNVQVASVTMFHRKITEKDFVALTLTNSGSWVGTVNSSFADDMGFEYYFEALDGSGNKGRNPAGTTFHRSRTTHSQTAPTLDLPIAGNATSWKVITIPFELSNRQVQNLFSVLGEKDTKKWRLLTYDQSPAPKGSWKEFPAFTSIEPGTGYFINTRNTTPVAISLAGAEAPAYTRDNLFPMQLKAGWNQIGNPYAVPIQWENVRTYNNAAANVGALQIFSGGYGPGTDALQPLQGGFVFVQTATTVMIPFLGQVSPGRERLPFSTSLDEPAWSLSMNLTQGDMANGLGGIGMHPEALTGYDEFDNVTPPRFMEFLDVKFDHEEFKMGSFSRDIVPTKDDYTWEFNVESNLEGLAQFRWSNQGFGSGSFDLFLFDIEINRAINMREETAYHFDPKVSKKFRIFFGKDARDRIKPEHSLLGQPYPNPTSGISYIPFALPDGKAEYGVKIEVFDLMGRKVTTLEDGQFAPGLHNTQWNGQDSPHGTGLYSVRMTVVTSEDQEVYNAKIVVNK